jgi:hypothetical protein
LMKACSSHTNSLTIICNTNSQLLNKSNIPQPTATLIIQIMKAKLERALTPRHQMQIIREVLFSLLHLLVRRKLPFSNFPWMKLLKRYSKLNNKFNSHLILYKIQHRTHSCCKSKTVESPLTYHQSYSHS